MRKGSKFQTNEQYKNYLKKDSNINGLSLTNNNLNGMTDDGSKYNNYDDQDKENSKKYSNKQENNINT